MASLQLVRFYFKIVVLPVEEKRFESVFLVKKGLYFHLYVLFGFAERVQFHSFECNIDMNDLCCV